MKQSRWLWNVSRVSFVAGVLLLSAPDNSNAAVSLGDVRFTLSELLLFVALAAGWGDARRQILDIRKELDRVVGRLDKEGS